MKFSLASFAQKPGNDNAGVRSAAIILTVKGQAARIQNVELYSLKVYTGSAKFLYGPESVFTNNPVFIQVYDSEGMEIFNGYVDNPLQERLESFNPDGSIERTEIIRDKGALNFKFRLSDSIGYYTVKVYQILSEEKVLADTLQIEVK